jgi:HD-GYP domain-containing protein (c-di-GMP phosphodiesterase class II)
MEAHPVRGADLLKRHADFARGVAIVRHHHEAWDGKGYPDGLKGTEIPFGARVIAVADSFDAMTSDRPYRKGMTVQKAADILHQGRGGQWDASIVDAFLRTISGQLDLQPANNAPARQPTAPGSSAAMGMMGKTA